jgi:hypothetical protein
MTATISSNHNKAAVVSPDSAVSKVSSSKAKEVAPGSAPEIINKVPATKISSTPSAVVSLGNSKSAGLDLYQRDGNLQKPATNTGLGATIPSSNSKTTSSAELKPEKEKVVKEAKSEAKKDVKVETRTNTKFAEPAPDESDDFVAGKGDVVVEVKASESGYDNRIFWSTDNFTTKNYIGTDNQTGNVNLGKFKEGTKIQFGIDNGAGQFFKSGPASRNVDNIAHAKVTKTSEGSEFGFEDLMGGGDRDFNDAIIKVRNLPAEEQQTGINAPEVTSKTVKQKTKINRSGLGDGTNPGQGGGTANATNQGTNNPGLGKASAYTTKMVVESQLKVAV